MVMHSVVVQALNLRDAPSSTDGNVLRVLPEGSEVDLVRYVDQDPRWVEVTDSGVRGFVSRRHLAQKSLEDFSRPDGINEREVADIVWGLTETHDRIQYRLGCKARVRADGLLEFSNGGSCDGERVDCSGWTRALFGAVAGAANKAAGRKVFANRDMGLLSTHSDAQVFETGRRTGQIASGPQIDGALLRSGMLVGINAGDWDWERESNSPARVFGIDHIVMFVRDPRTGAGFITQSSSSGNGVNLSPWDEWVGRFGKLIETWRMHAVDPLMLGDWRGLAPMGPSDDLDDGRADEVALGAPAG